MNTKVCTKCKQEKTYSQMAKNKSNADGMASWCKECYKTRSYEYRHHPNYDKEKYDAYARKQRQDKLGHYIQIYKTNIHCSKCEQSIMKDYVKEEMCPSCYYD